MSCELLAGMNRKAAKVFPGNPCPVSCEYFTGISSAAVKAIPGLLVLCRARISSEESSWRGLTAAAVEIISELVCSVPCEKLPGETAALRCVVREDISDTKYFVNIYLSITERAGTASQSECDSRRGSSCVLSDCPACLSVYVMRFFFFRDEENKI